MKRVSTVLVLFLGFALAACQREAPRAADAGSAGAPVATPAMQNKIDMVLIPKIRDSGEASLKLAQKYLDVRIFETAWNNGRALAEKGLEHVIAYATEL